jgi:hypothetical protein
VEGCVVVKISSVVLIFWNTEVVEDVFLGLFQMEV